MKRFLMLLAVAAIAGVMYVAAAPGSALHAGPTARQFAALKKQVVALQKKVKTLQTDTNVVGTVVFHCMLHSVIGVDQKGDPAGTFGFQYTTTSGGAVGSTTGLDLAPNGTTPTYLIAPLNTSDAACQQVVGLAGLKHGAAVFAQKR
jgi:hypothetical protein